MQAEYQVPPPTPEQLAHPRFHHPDKCGYMQNLRPYKIQKSHSKGVEITKKHYRLEKKCFKHGVNVDVLGWEWGFIYGEDSRALNKRNNKRS